MYWPTLLAWFRKDVTVKQVALNVTDMDKINIVSSQAVLDMPSFTLDVLLATGQQPRQKSTVHDRTRHRWAAVSIHPHYGFACGRHDVAWQLISRNPQHWDLGCLEEVGRKKVWRFLTQQFNCCTCAVRYVGSLSCWNKVVTRHSAYRW